MVKSETVFMRRGPGGKLNFGVGFVLIMLRGAGKVEPGFNTEGCPAGAVDASELPAVGATEGVGKLFCCSRSRTVLSAADGAPDGATGSTFFLVMIDANGSAARSFVANHEHLGPSWRYAAEQVSVLPRLNVLGA
jgi:hypothetical protein